MAWPPKARAARSVRRSAALSLVLGGSFSGAWPALPSRRRTTKPTRTGWTAPCGSWRAHRTATAGSAPTAMPGEPSDPGIHRLDGDRPGRGRDQPPEPSQAGRRKRLRLPGRAREQPRGDERLRAGAARRGRRGHRATGLRRRRPRPGDPPPPAPGRRLRPTKKVTQTPGVNDTVFAILALSPIQEPAGPGSGRARRRVARGRRRTPTAAGPSAAPGTLRAAAASRRAKST